MGSLAHQSAPSLCSHPGSILGAVGCQPTKYGLPWLQTSCGCAEYALAPVSVLYTAQSIGLLQAHTTLMLLLLLGCPASLPQWLRRWQTSMLMCVIRPRPTGTLLGPSSKTSLQVCDICAGAVLSLRLCLSRFRRYRLPKYYVLWQCLRRVVQGLACLVCLLDNLQVACMQRCMATAATQAHRSLLASLL